METPYTINSVKTSALKTIKKIVFAFFIFLTAMSGINSAQAQTSSATDAKRIIADRGEVFFSFRAQTPEQVIELAKVISIDHKRVDVDALEVDAYANAEEFDKFLDFGLPFVAKTDYDISYIHTPTANRDPWDGDNSWDSYPTYTEYVATMTAFVTNYPTLCTLETIGTSTNGRNIYVLKISDNAAAEEAEPKFLYTSSMHGDEIAGFPLMIRLIDHLLSNYGLTTADGIEATNLVNNNQIYISPSTNPDGSYDGGADDNVIDGPTRGNANGRDLHRNYMDMWEGVNPDGFAYQAETLAFMNWEQNHQFVLGINFHGGAEVITYPWDNLCPGNNRFGGSTSIPYPERYSNYTEYYELIAQEYAGSVQANAGPLGGGYFDADYDTSFDGNPGTGDGVSNAALWYILAGGRQDYLNYYLTGRELTVELSNNKQLSGSQLPNHWNANKQALLNFIKQANYGIQGTITDSETGLPVEAYVYLTDKYQWNSGEYSTPAFGNYTRLVEAGSWSMTVEAPCYQTQTITGISVTDGVATTLNVSLVPTAEIPLADPDVTINTGETATLNATGSGTITWWDAEIGGTLQETGNTFVTPTLTATTSYWVEDEVTAPAKIVDAPSYTSGGAYRTGTRVITFDAHQAVHIDKVTINSDATGSFPLLLKDQNGTTLASTTVVVPVTGVQEVTVNIDVPKGYYQTLEMQLGSMGLYRTGGAANVTYPYEYPGLITIKNEELNDIYYYGLYNWQLTEDPCKSRREEVVVNVDLGPCPGGITTYTTGGGWSNGAPSLTKQAVFQDSYSTASGSIDACTVTVQNGATLTVIAGTYVNVDGDITVDAGAILDVLHEGAVVQINNNSNAVNNGTINVRKTTPSMAAKDFSVMASPITGETRDGVYAAAFRAFAHNTANFDTNDAVGAIVGDAINFVDQTGNDRILLNGSEAINPAQGYLIFPQASPTDSGIYNLNYVATSTSGTLNNGSINKSLIYNGSSEESANLIGNPYASAIDAYDFIAANAHIPVLYFWEHNTPRTTGPAYLGYTMEDISYFNSSGGTAAASDPGNIPNKYIASGQGFGIKPTSGSDAVFNNGMRETTNNNTFKSGPDFTANRIWLRLDNALYKEFTSTMLVAFVPGATDGLDLNYDAKRIGTYTSLFSEIDGWELGIQGRTAFNEDDQITIGFKTLVPESTTYSIGISQIEGAAISGATAYLIDNELGITTNISERDYLFTESEGHFPGRFTLFFKNNVLDTQDFEFGDATISMYPNPGQDVITLVNSSNQTIEALNIFDIQGRKVITVPVNNAALENTFSVGQLPQGVFMVEVVSQNATLYKRLIKN
ncbi:MAG: M14 family zinc carboxypeptidase [Gilvibacter sp.]